MPNFRTAQAYLISQEEGGLKILSGLTGLKITEISYADHRTHGAEPDGITVCSQRIINQLRQSYELKVSNKDHLKHHTKAQS